MNTLVTGGTGFIGRVLVRRLLADGNKVMILTRDEGRVDNSIKGKVGVSQVNICNSASVERLAPRLLGIDALIHLAASLDYFGDKRKLFQANVSSTVNLLNLAQRNGIKRFIFISSIEAMGTIREDDIPADETFVCQPVSTYGESKLEVEKRVSRFAEEKNLSTIILRLGNVYGPGSSAFVVPIANAILKKDALLRFLPVYKDSYLHPIYIDDVVDGIVKSVQRSDVSETYILSGEEYVAIETLFSLIAQGLDINIDSQIKNNVKDALYLNLRKKFHRFRKRADLITYFMPGQGRNIHRAYSIERAKRELGYSPKVSLRDGVAKTIEWAKQEGLLETGKR